MYIDFSVCKTLDLDATKIKAKIACHLMCERLQGMTGSTGCTGQVTADTLAVRYFANMLDSMRVTMMADHCICATLISSGMSRVGCLGTVAMLHSLVARLCFGV